MFPQHVNDIDSIEEGGLRIFSVEFLGRGTNRAQIAFRLNHPAKMANLRFLKRAPDKGNGDVQLVTEFVLGKSMNAVGGMKQF